VLINVTGGDDLTLYEVSEASTLICEEADVDANIIFGAVIDPLMQGRVRITLIATGFDRIAKPKPRARIEDKSRNSAQQSLLPSEVEIDDNVDLSDPNVPAYLRAAASADANEKL
jgi:cell division protein FtsZ